MTALFRHHLGQSGLLPMHDRPVDHVHWDLLHLHSDGGLQRLPGFKEEQHWLQQDGVTPHTARSTLAWLQQHFADQLISLKTRVPWAPHSPDHSPLDYVLWGYLKSIKCRQAHHSSAAEGLHQDGDAASASGHDQTDDHAPAADPVAPGDGETGRSLRARPLIKVWTAHVV